MGMELLTKLINRITGLEISAQATDQGEALVAAGMAEYEEITRQGFAYHVASTTPTIGVTAIPTQACSIGIFNSAADNGKSLIIDAIWAMNIVAEATLGQCGLIAVVGQTRVAALTSAFTVRKSNGNGPGSDTVALAATGGAVLDAVTGVAAGWFPIGETANITVLTLPGVILYAEVNGRIIVPPGRQFGINVMCNHIDDTFVTGVMWHEKVLKLG